MSLPLASCLCLTTSQFFSVLWSEGQRRPFSSSGLCLVVCLRWGEVRDGFAVSTEMRRQARLS